MNIESTIIQSVTTDLIDTTDIPPLIVDEDNAYDDIYVGKEVRVSQTRFINFVQRIRRMFTCLKN